MVPWVVVEYHSVKQCIIEPLLVFLDGSDSVFSPSCQHDEVGELGVVSFEIVSFHLEFVKFLGSILYLGCIQEGRVKHVLELFPELFVVLVSSCCNLVFQPESSVS